MGDPLLESDPFAGIHQQFRARHPSDSAARIYTRLESEGRLHCVAVAYLSPEAGELARELGGQPVPCPAWVEASGG